MIAPVRADDVRTHVQAKGFLPEEGEPGKRKKNRDHEFFWYWHKGALTNWWVKLSSGVGEIRTDEIRNNARAIQILGDELHGILACSIGPAEVAALYEKNHGAPPSLSCPCGQPNSGVPVLDDKGRKWHADCAGRHLQRHPWTYGKAACPSCGVAEGERLVRDAGTRQWHAACGAAVLVSSSD